ncbi:MAG: hypothetical protein IT308_00550, partial [Anaerolineaceae bacterium]|nr:hypothetical protein [Anaerolineaceae bacterium]
KAPTTVLRDVGHKQADTLEKLGLRSVADLAAFPAIDEAEEIITRAPNEDDDPSAPSCVLPTCKKFGKNTKSYTSFFKEKEIRDLSVLCTGNSRIANLFKFGAVENKVIYLGYSVSYLQEWIYLGVHLGEPQGSVNLSMGQDTQVSMLDWRRAMRALRAEDTRVSERLASVLFHQRAVDEVARATAEEHQHGATSAFGANAATAGSFAAAGAIVGGVGGGISGGLVGLPIDLSTGGATLGLGTLSGAVIGTAVGSAAGAAAGSIIASGATMLGFVDTDVEGDREIFATSGQNIQQRTMQNSSSIRSFWSNIVSQSVEEEQQTIRTDRLTNHNRIHALNAILFEVLNGYHVNISAQNFAPILFLPFKPFTFSPNLLRDFWWLIRTQLVDKKLVKMLDGKYLRLTAAQSPIDQLEALPEIDDIKTSKVTVKVNLDSSAIVELLINAGITVAAGVIVATLREMFEAGKRDKVKAKLVTTNGTINLDRDSYDKENFIWEFSTTSAVKVASITAIRVINDNGKFDLFGFDLTSLKFDNVKAEITIKNKSSFVGAVPTLGQLERMQTVRSEEFSVGAKDSTDLPWTIGDQLRTKFEGVETLRAGLEEQKLEIENAEQAEAVLIDFLNANKFTFTRLILQGIEPEQVITALEDVHLGDINLSDIAGTTPLGFCANHVVLPMKACKIGNANYDKIGVDTSKLELILGEFEDLDRKKPNDVAAYLLALNNYLKQFLQTAASSGNGSVREMKLLDLVSNLLQLVKQALQVLAPATGSASGRNIKPTDSIKAIIQFDSRGSQVIQKILALLKSPVTSNPRDAALLCGYYDSVKTSLAKRIGEFLSSDEISLPSPAVFMEPILSNAKGAELYDMRRNSHYTLLESPSITAADPNALRGQDVNLTPTVPGSTLSVLPPPELRLPDLLTAALGEAGKLNLGTLIQSNASSLAGMLTNLSTMATELAKASATLTGDAQKQALASAVDVAKQIGDIVGKSLQNSSGETPPPPPTPSPRTQQEKAEIAREAKRIDKGNGTPQQKEEQKRTIGAATTPNNRRSRSLNVRMTFMSTYGVPIVFGVLTGFPKTFQIFNERDVRAVFDDTPGSVEAGMQQMNKVIDPTYTFALPKWSESNAALSVQIDYGGGSFKQTVDPVDIPASAGTMIVTAQIAARDQTVTRQRSVSRAQTLTELVQQKFGVSASVAKKIADLADFGFGLTGEWTEATTDTGTTTGSTTTTVTETLKIPTGALNITVQFRE